MVAHSSAVARRARMLVSYMPLAANARELDELGSRHKPTSPDVGGCRERFYLGGGMLVCCYERRGPRPPPMNRRRAMYSPPGPRMGPRLQQ